MTNISRKIPRFSSRTTMILACMGMAVGTGNIWRFPVQVAKNGGGSFLIPWFLFLFFWSIPLLIVELAVGQKVRRGPFAAFNKLMGSSFGWMGGFVSVCTMMIMCYYAVVTAWTFGYIIFSLGGLLDNLTDKEAIVLFDDFRGSPVVLLLHIAALGAAGFAVHRSAQGIEWLNKLLIPTLIFILIFGAANALFLADASAGIGFLFNVEIERLKDPSLWIAGLSQSAWSTGAGWGLMLAYAVYAREEEDPASIPLATGLGNNGVEMIVALMIFPAVFAVMGSAQAAAFISSSSSKGGIAFQVAPMLFGRMPLGSIVNILFFVGLASAALTSLVAMLELSTRFFMDFGITRGRALSITLAFCLLLGIPSALSDSFFDNQDFVWGVGLILSGIFLSFLVLRYGPAKFVSEFLHPKATFFKAGKGFQILLYLVFIEGIALLCWWLWEMKNAGINTLISCFLQWGLVIAVLLLFRKRLSQRMEQSKP